MTAHRRLRRKRRGWSGRGFSRCDAAGCLANRSDPARRRRRRLAARSPRRARARARSRSSPSCCGGSTPDEVAIGRRLPLGRSAAGPRRRRLRDDLRHRARAGRGAVAHRSATSTARSPRSRASTGSRLGGAARARSSADLLGRATEAEADFIRRLFTGELRQGALAGLMVDAVAKAAGVPGAARAPRADALGRPHADGRDRDDGGRGGAARGRLRDLPADPPDARLDRRDRGRGGRGLRARLGRVEARRDPHPDPPPRRRGPHLHPQPQRHHGVAARASSRRCGACRSSQAVFDGEALWMREHGPAAFQDTVSQIDGDGAAGGDRDLPLRPAPPRRRGPARHAARGARRAARGDRAAAQDPERAHLRPGRRRSASSTSR